MTTDLMTTKAQYQNYDEVLGKSKNDEKMTYREKKKLIQQIDKLETKDHLGILRIIMDSTTKKIYTVNNYGTYIDLDDLDNQTLWKISYFVNLCLENLDREKEKELAEKKHQERITQLETNLKNRSKLKLTPQNLSISSKAQSSKKSDKIDDDEESSDEDSNLSPENLVIQKNKIGIDTDSDLPISNEIESEFDPDQQEDEEDF